MLDILLKIFVGSTIIAATFCSVAVLGYYTSWFVLDAIKRYKRYKLDFNWE